MTSDTDLCAARRELLRAHKFTYCLSLLMSRQSRERFWAWYSYLRWVDDAVDKRLLPSDREAFVAQQLRRLSLPSDGSDPNSVLEERLLSRFVWHDDASNGTLQATVTQMLSCIAFDASRTGQVCEQAKLQEYYRREVSAYLTAIALLCGLPDVAPPVGVSAALAAKSAHIIRDLREDLEAGQINISREDLDAYGLDWHTALDPPAPKPLLAWIASQVRLADCLMSEGLEAVRYCSSLRYKILVCILAAKYQIYLRNFKRGGFLCGDESKPRKISVFVQTINNLIVVIGGSTIRVEAQSHFPPIVHLSPLEKVALAYDLHPLTNQSALRDLHGTLQPVRGRVPEESRMDRRFRGGYWLGRSSFSAIAPGLARERSLAHCAGLLVGYWGLSAIEFDRLQDERILPNFEILRLAKRWVDVLHCAVNCKGSIKGLDLKSCHKAYMFSLFTDRLLSLVRRVSTLSPDRISPERDETAKAAFLRFAEFLMLGQMTSMGQTDLKIPKSWSWYYREIMNHKNVEFLLTPFRLWCLESHGPSRFDEIATSFSLLNRAYVHYQLLDDLADASEDIAQQVIGAPGFVLLTQSAIGASYLRVLGHDLVPDNGPSGAESTEAVIDQVVHSDLLCDEFVNSPLFDGRRHLLSSGGRGELLEDRAERFVRCAISNTSAEFHEPLFRVAERRFREGDSYLTALRRRSFDAARSSLLDSRVHNRILSAAGEESAVTSLRQTLATIDNPGHLRVLYIMEGLMRRTLRAATDFTQGPSTIERPS